MTKRNDKKLTFFENIYYWLWYSLPKPEQYGNKPSPLIGFTLTIFWIINGLSIILLFQVITHANFTTLGNGVWVLILVAILLALFIVSYIEKRYEKKIENISLKVNQLTPKQRIIKIIFFFIYIIISIGLLFLIPCLR